MKWKCAVETAIILASMLVVPIRVQEVHGVGTIFVRHGGIIHSLNLGVTTADTGSNLSSTVGTVYINPDGRVNPKTPSIATSDNITYTLTEDVIEAIVVERSDITLNGNGHELQADPVAAANGSGIALAGTYHSTTHIVTGLSNVTVENVKIRGFAYGIVVQSPNATIRGNNVTDCGSIGIFLRYSPMCSVATNYVSHNIWGVYLWNSPNCELQNNTMVGDHYNLGVDGNIGAFENSISTSNTVNGKIVYYLVNQNNIVIDPSTCPNPGYLALVNSTDIAVQNLNFASNQDGILLVNTNNSRISNVYATENYAGIVLAWSSNVTVESCTASINFESGIGLYSSDNCTITSNTVINQTEHAIVGASNGIELTTLSDYNVVTANNILSNRYGIYIAGSESNCIYHNNFIGNSVQAGTTGDLNNWSQGSPQEGNYWSDYFFDISANNDGLGNVPYTIDTDNQDAYPLMGTFSEYQVSSTNSVQTICNSTVSDFTFNGTAISFNVSGENDTSGFCRIRVPTLAFNDSFKVYVNGTEVAYALMPCSNGKYDYLYFTYNHSTQRVVIVPEFLSSLIVPSLATTTMIIAIHKRKHANNV